MSDCPLFRAGGYLSGERGFNAVFGEALAYHKAKSGQQALACAATLMLLTGFFCFAYAGFYPRKTIGGIRHWQSLTNHKTRDLVLAIPLIGDINNVRLPLH